MKNPSSVICSFSAALLFLVFCIESHASQKSINVVTEIDWSDSEVIEGGEGSLTTQISVLVLEQMGYEVKLSFHPWARAKRMTLDGVAAGVSGIYFTEQRTELLAFTDPIITTQQVLFKLKESDIQYSGDLKTLTPYSIGVVRNYTYGDLFDQDTQLKKVVSIKPSNNLNMLLAKRVDLIVGSTKSIEFLLKETFPQRVNDIVSFGPPIYEQNVHFAFSKTLPNHQELTKLFNQKLSEIRADGTFQKLEESFRASLSE